MHYLNFLFINIALLTIYSSNAFTSELTGWIENVQISPGDSVITAKIDTGADTSSLHCDCEPPYISEGEHRIRFSITGINGHTTYYDKPIIRRTKIKQHMGGTLTRPVVVMGICLGNQFAQTEVNLVDRSAFNYRMLIGRNFLAGRFIVDPSRQYALRPDCAVITE